MNRRIERPGPAALYLALLLAVSGCAERPETGSAGALREPAAQPEVQTERVRIVFLGDSLTAGFGLAEDQAFPSLVAQRLTEDGHEVRVINAGVSGDTTAGGLSRVDWVLQQSPDVLFVSLGANDGLRGLQPEVTEANLRQIVERGQSSGARVILAGMRLPPNYGPDYVRDFEEIFPRLAEELDVGWVPFLLEGVAGRRSLNLVDGIHPNARGHERIAEHVMPALLDALEEIGP